VNRLYRNPHLYLDAGATILSGVTASWILSSGVTFKPTEASGLFSLATAVSIRLLIFISFGVYKTLWRHAAFRDFLLLITATTISCASILIVRKLVFAIPELPTGFFILEALMTAALVTASRVCARAFSEFNVTPNQNRRRTLIYGAGIEGRALARRLLSDSTLPIHPLGFIDDDIIHKNRTITGLKVLGSRADLKSVVQKYRIQELVIAIGNIDGKTLYEVMKTAHTLHIRPQLLDNFGFRNSKSRRPGHFRDIKIDDLLQRPKVSVDLASVADLIHGKRILVTGGGGSIGSELCRQILKFMPEKLVAVDQSEFNLYTLTQDIESKCTAGPKLVPILLDLKIRSGVEAVFREHRPQIIFHAAAYKHVDLVELNPCPSILNNILSMRNLLDLSQTYRTDGFVLISSDKAVNPSGVMGTTKRACELMVVNAAHTSKSNFCSVRFGNVLGTSGSFIPLMKQQIRSGGPVTITHPDMARYFMLSREAVSLVLKAASITKPGDIYILKMGEPIKILKILKTLIALLGRQEDEVPIVYTGIRPGEKLVEELYLCGNEQETAHPDIVVLPNGETSGYCASPENKNVSVWIDEIIDLANNNDGMAPEILNRLVKHFARPVSTVEPIDPKQENNERNAA
jgi:FlaA1/EpsC-like NDP-sugar epimerase